VVRALCDGASLCECNTMSLEIGRAGLRSIPLAYMACVSNTGSEATCQAIRMARAYTSRGHVIVI
jgi:glutamate-1-semialdehyde aminotransferase